MQRYSTTLASVTNATGLCGPWHPGCDKGTGAGRGCISEGTGYIQAEEVERGVLLLMFDRFPWMPMNVGGAAQGSGVYTMRVRIKTDDESRTGLGGGIAAPLGVFKYAAFNTRTAVDLNRSSNVKTVLGRAKPSIHNPLFGEDRDWETSTSYPNVAYDPQALAGSSTRWQLWYMTLIYGVSPLLLPCVPYFCFWFVYICPLLPYKLNETHSQTTSTMLGVIRTPPPSSRTAVCLAWPTRDRPMVLAGRSPT